MSPVFLLIVQLCMAFLRNVKGRSDCPDGVCDEALESGELLTAQLESLPPTVGVGIFDIFRFMRAFPMDRVFAVGKRIMALLSTFTPAPGGQFNFADFISKIDLKEAVSIIQEILSILGASKIVNGGGNREITLGEAVS